MLLEISVACREGEEVWGGLTPPSPKFRRPSKIMPNSTRLWKLLKLPPVRNCFTLAMTYKLVVIINILKEPKILLYEMKFLVPNYSCLQKIPVFSVLNWICWKQPPPTKFLDTPFAVHGTEFWSFKKRKERKEQKMRENKRKKREEKTKRKEDKRKEKTAGFLSRRRVN